MEFGTISRGRPALRARNIDEQTEVYVTEMKTRSGTSYPGARFVYNAEQFKSRQLLLAARDTCATCAEYHVLVPSSEGDSQQLGQVVLLHCSERRILCLISTLL